MPQAKTNTKSNVIELPKKQIREGLEDQKAAAEELGWKFEFNDEGIPPHIWKATNPKAVLSDITNESLGTILKRIEIAKYIGEQELKAVVITDETRLPDNTEVSFVADGNRIEGYVFDVASNKTRYLVKAEVGGNVRNFYLLPDELTVKENRGLQPKRAKIAFAGSFTLKNGDEKTFVLFHFSPKGNHLVFQSSDASPISKTGFRSDFGAYLSDSDSIEELVVRRTRFNIADQYNEQTGKKQKSEKKVLSENIEILDLKFEPTETYYLDYFESLKNDLDPDKPAIETKEVPVETNSLESETISAEADETFDIPRKQQLPKTVARECRYELSDEEALMRATTLVNAMRERGEEITAFTELKKKHQEKLLEIDKRENLARSAVDTRVEYRTTECYQSYDYLLEKVTIRRPDTDDIVEVRDMTREERQQKLFV